MKNFTKICIIVCVVFLVISAVCAGIGIAMGSGYGELKQMAKDGEFSIGGNRIDRWNDDEWDHEGDKDTLDGTEISSNKLTGTYNKSFPADDISNLNIEILYGNIEIIDSGSEYIDVSIDAPNTFKYTCEEKNNTFNLIDKTNFDIIGRVLPEDVNITIAIPKGKHFSEADITSDASPITLSHELSAKNIDIDVKAGSIYASSLTAEEEVDIDVDAGKVEIDNLYAQNSDITCKVGEVTVNGKIEGDVSAECDMGRIRMELAGVVEDYNYEVSCGLGRVELNGESYSSYVRKSHNNRDDDHDDDESYIDNNAKWDMDLECGVGEIDVTFR